MLFYNKRNIRRTLDNLDLAICNCDTVLGLIVGYVVDVATKTRQKNIVVASIAFSSISIPLVLAAAIVAGLPSSTLVGTNPITLIAIYAIVFPILQ
jgi:hypothetical protein